MSGERLLSRESLVEIERRLATFQFECEAAGIWPNARTLPALQGDTTAPGLLSELLHEYAFLRKVYRYPDEDWKEEEVLAGGIDWPIEWVIEIKRTLRMVRIVLEQMFNLWRPAIGSIEGLCCATIDGKLEYFVPGSFTLRAGPEATIGEILPPVPEDVATVIQQCQRRLRRILAECLVPPCDLEETVAHQGGRSPSRAGRRPDPVLPTIKQEVADLREKDIEWKEIADTIHTKFKRRYAVSSLQDLLKPSRKKPDGG